MSRLKSEVDTERDGLLLNLELPAMVTSSHI